MRVKPVNSPVTYPFGVKDPLYRLGYHPGTDYLAPSGTHAVACEAGIVTWLKSGSAGNVDGTYGNQMNLALDSGGALYYCHLDKPLVGNSHVSTGQAICVTDNTGLTKGAHLHIEWRPTDDLNNPQDFEKWLSKGGNEVTDAEFATELNKRDQRMDKIETSLSSLYAVVDNINVQLGKLIDPGGRLDTDYANLYNAIQELKPKK